MYGTVCLSLLGTVECACGQLQVQLVSISYEWQCMNSIRPKDRVQWAFVILYFIFTGTAIHEIHLFVMALEV